MRHRTTFAVACPGSKGCPPVRCSPRCVALPATVAGEPFNGLAPLNEPFVHGETMTGGTRVIGYVRVSTAEQALSGAGLQAQRDAIERESKARGWVLVDVIKDAGYSA